MPLLKKDTMFCWDEWSQESFDVLKWALALAPVIIPPDYSRDFLLYVSASMETIGMVLVQEDEELVLTQKSPTQLSMAYTTQGHHLTTFISLHKTFHDLPFDPHTSKRAQGWRKGLKPQKRAQNRPFGAKALKKGLKPWKGLKLGWKGLKAQKRV